MVKKLIAGILGKKEDDAKAAAPASDVPDELPPLAEDMIAQDAPKEVKVESSPPVPLPSLPNMESSPEELPPLSESPTTLPDLEHGTLADLEPNQGPLIPDAIKKAKLAKLKETLPAPAAPSSTVQTAAPRQESRSIVDDLSVKERIKTGYEVGFFSNILDHIKRNDGAKEKLLAGDLFVRMDNYWDLRKHEIKAGQPMPAEKKLDDDLMAKLEELKVLEQKWQVQKLALDEDLKFLHEREREIQSKVKELRLISNELNLFKSVKPEEYFYMRNGVVLKNLHDLVDVLEIIDDDAYNFHVKSNRNDFADWIKHVFRDNHLGDKLKMCKTKGEMIETLEKIPTTSDFMKEKDTLMATNPKRYFWLSNGVVIRSLFELSDALRTMDDSLFEKHVNSTKNDFAMWVSVTLRNEALGSKMARSRSRREMLELIEVFL